MSTFRVWYKIESRGTLGARLIEVMLLEFSILSKFIMNEL